VRLRPAAGTLWIWRVGEVSPSGDASPGSRTSPVPRPSFAIIVAVKIYTKTGDAGETGLFDGTRVPKSNARVDAYGEVDELNAWLGFVASAAGIDADVTAVLTHLQRDLFAVGARLADPSSRIAGRVTKAVVSPADIERLEGWIDAFEAELPPLRRFILAGGTTAGASLHLARTVCRRAERRIVALGPDAVGVEVLAFINRLSDLLFVLARVVNARAHVSETEW
jgi:cob(I)alamin adenosyltransferase